MTRMVPRPDWTPVEFVLAVRAMIASEMWTTEAMATHPAVLALFRPAEESECSHEWIRTMEGTPEWCRKCLGPKDDPAPVAPPPAEERADLPASEESSWAPVLVESRTPETESVMIHHAHRGQACVACEHAALRAENERLKAAIREAFRDGVYWAWFNNYAESTGAKFNYQGHIDQQAAEYAQSVPSGENRSVDAGSPPAGGTAK